MSHGQVEGATCAVGAGDISADSDEEDALLALIAVARAVVVGAGIGARITQLVQVQVCQEERVRVEPQEG